MNLNSPERFTANNNEGGSVWKNLSPTERVRIDELVSLAFESVEKHFDTLGGEKLTVRERNEHLIQPLAKFIRTLPEVDRSIVLQRALAINRNTMMVAKKIEDGVISPGNNPVIDFARQNRNNRGVLRPDPIDTSNSLRFDPKKVIAAKSTGKYRAAQQGEED